MVQGLDHEQIEEVKKRLRDGESARSISDDFDVSHTTINNYADELEEEIELEKRVKETSGPTIEDVREAADSVPGIGDATLDAVEEMADTRPKILEDPNELYKYINRLTDLEHDWIDHIVKATFPHMDDPSGQPDQTQASPGYYPGGGGGQQPSASYNPQGGQQGYNPQGGQQQGGGGQQDEIAELKQTVNKLAEAVTEDQQQDGSGDMVEVELEDGRTIRAPPHSPIVQQNLGGGSDDDDFLEKIKKAQEAGVLPKPDDGDDGGTDDMMEMIAKLRELGILDDDSEEMVEVMSEQMGQVVDQVAEAQKMTANQISTAMEEIARQENESDDGEQLSREEVQEILEEERKKDKIDRLEEKLEERTEQLEEQVSRRTSMNANGENDPEVIKQEREYDFRETQLEAVNQNFERVLEELPHAIREGVVPAVKALDDSDLPTTPGLWTPPEGGRRGPPQAAQAPPRQRQGGGQAQQEPPAQPPAEPDEGYPDAEPGQPNQKPEPEPEPEQTQDENAIEERAQDVRSTLGLDDDADAEEAEA